MDENIETFIYILMMLIFVIIGSLSKKKKKKIVTNTNTTSSGFEESFKQKPKNILDLFEDRIKDVIKLEDEPQRTDDFEIVSEETIKEEEAEPVLYETNEANSSIEEDKKISEKHLLEEFDLKRAVIYSEILKRKYY